MLKHVHPAVMELSEETENILLKYIEIPKVFLLLPKKDLEQ